MLVCGIFFLFLVMFLPQTSGLVHPALHGGAHMRVSYSYARVGLFVMGCYYYFSPCAAPPHPEKWPLLSMLGTYHSCGPGRCRGDGPGGRWRLWYWLCPCGVRSQHDLSPWCILQ